MKKLKFSKPKKITVSKMKDRAWKVFSLYIRTKGSTNGLNVCVTCGLWKPIKKLQAGHFIPGRHNSILFDERGVHCQCYRCNVALKGNPRAYDAYMRRVYGQKVIFNLELLDIQSKQFKVFELEELLIKYTKKLKSILDRKDLPYDAMI